MESKIKDAKRLSKIVKDNLKIFENEVRLNKKIKESASDIADQFGRLTTIFNKLQKGINSLSETDLDLIINQMKEFTKQQNFKNIENMSKATEDFSKIIGHIKSKITLTTKATRNFASQVKRLAQVLHLPLVNKFGIFEDLRKQMQGFENIYDDIFTDKLKESLDKNDYQGIYQQVHSMASILASSVDDVGTGYVRDFTDDINKLQKQMELLGESFKPTFELIKPFLEYMRGLNKNLQETDKTFSAIHKHLDPFTNHLKKLQQQAYKIKTIYAAFFKQMD